MKKISILVMTGLIAFFMLSCSATPAKEKQEVQIFTTTNNDSKVTTKSIQEAFNSVGLNVLGNNDMNKPFKSRFGTLHYNVYNLGIFMNNDLTFNLLKKYPKFGALTPLTMSIWEGKDGSMNISTISTKGIARVIGIPIDDPDLIAYANLIEKGLKAAMPNGSFKDLDYKVPNPLGTLTTDFVIDVDLDDSSPEDYIEDFEDEFESELASAGFLFPNYSNVQEDIFDEKGYTDVYDFYHTYSFCKFDVIYPVSKAHPEAGAWAPCSFYIYKKKGEDKMYMGFLSVDNWISTIAIKDDESIKPLQEAQGLLESIIKDITE